jgi:FkbM family methyltransferase
MDVSIDDRRGILAGIASYQERRGGAHCAGTLTGGPLTTIQWYLETYFGGRPVRVIETGCGASTILFSHYAEKHYSFCYDDRQSENSSVAFATEFPGFRADKVEWVFGPTQLTVPKHAITEPVDIVLIDGPHGFPYAELEYYYFYRLLRENSILIIDDIHIPTLRNLFNFLSQDDMFYLHQVTATTAFFVRSSEPTLDPTGDDWWLQRYNIQNFPAWKPRVFNPGYHLPVHLSFDGRSSNLDHLAPRGIILVDGKLVTEGKLSWIRLPVECEDNCDLDVALDLELVAPDQRPGAGFEWLLNGERSGLETATGPRRRLVAGPVRHRNSSYIEIKFHSFCLKYADQIDGFPAAYFDRREPGVVIHSIRICRANVPDAPRLDLHSGQIAEFEFRDKAVRFFVDHPGDSIQSFHAIGRFYEEEELKLIEEHVAPRSIILDVGANIGNHMVYFEKFMAAKEIIPIEPLPRAIKLLKLNASLNNLTKVDFSLLGTALGDAPSKGSLHTADPSNLGGTVTRQDPSGDVPISKGDDILHGRRVDFIKIDVEGQELAALAGLAATIAASAPTIFVEVQSNNISDVHAFMKGVGYKKVAEYQRYEGIINFLFEKRKARSWFKTGFWPGSSSS